jgi:hypothetical protein
MLALVLALPPWTTGESLGLRRFRTVAVGAEYRLAQRFTMNEDGLNAITLRPAVVGEPRGRVRITLRDGAGVVHADDVAADEFARRHRYVFAFAPVRDSAAREFLLEIAPDPGSPVAGVAFWATKGASAAEGGLRINDVPRWANLAFETRTMAAAPGLMLLRRRESDGWPRWPALFGLVGASLAFRYVVRGVLRAFDGGAVPPPLSTARPDDSGIPAVVTTSHDVLGAPPAATR